MPNAEIYSWRKAHKFCTACGKEKAMPNRILCPACIEKSQNYANAKYSVAKAHEYQARRREIYHEKKANGVCVSCSKLATHGLYCYECSIKSKRKHQRYAEKRKAERHDRGLIPEIRESNGLCYFCGQPVEEPLKHGRACNACAILRSADSQKADKSIWRNMIDSDCRRIEKQKRGEENAE